MSKPITPSQASKKRQADIPAFVFEIINRLITENLSLSGTATIRQENVEAEIRRHLKEGEQFPSSWLDVESLYREAGWEVEYDKPGYNESYPATFTFKTPL